MIVDLPANATHQRHQQEDHRPPRRGRRGHAGPGADAVVIAPDSEDLLEDSIEAANFASREHPCRVIVVVPGDRKAAEPRLDAQIRVGGDAGAGEVVVLRLAR